MLRNYVKIALRTLWKQKGITAINVLGLAAGMAVCLLVGLLMWDQVTHDDFHPGADRLYRVTTAMELAQPFATSPAGLAPTMREGVAGVETATRMRETHQNVVVDNQGYEAQGLYAEPSFFDLFGFDLVAGGEAEALSKPYTAVVSNDLARRLFGDADPRGRTLKVRNVGTVTVTGIINREAYRSHLPFDVLYSFATLEHTRSQQLDDWSGSAYEYFTYLRLKEGRRPAAVEQSLRTIRQQHLRDDDSIREFQLQALSEIPLSARMQNDVAEGMLAPFPAYFLAALALLVLLAAGFNYVNLSTARSLTRNREVGIRKTLGAYRQQVMGQFVAEAIVVALLALVLAIGALYGLVPAFNELSFVRQMQIPIEVEPGPPLFGAFLFFAIVVGAVAGLYPAWHLSKFQPARVLKTSVRSKTPGFKWLTSRKMLVILQFAAAFVVLVSALVFYRQAQHLTGEAYPIQVDHVARVELQDASLEPFQREARRVPGVQQVGAVGLIPATNSTEGCNVNSNRLPDPTTETWCHTLDYEAVQLLELPLVVTQGFTANRFDSGRAVLINETAVQHLGFESPQEALGQPLTVLQANPEQADRQWDVQVAGVVEDFPFGQFRSARPTVFHYDPSRFRAVLARVQPGQEQAALDSLQAAWGNLETVDPFAGEFLRDRLRNRTAAPMTDTGWILGLVAALAVLISCLGLLGIATYTVQTRMREVGIRKALGATLPSLVTLLSRDFLWLMGIAITLGVPLAWWLNRLWLQNFAYRIELGVATFALSAAALIGLALLTIGSQTVRAARTDPATTLRDE